MPVRRAILDAQQAAALLLSARQLFSRGELDEARRTCGGILTAFPQHAGALHLSGVIAHRQGDAAAAAHLLQRAVAAPDTLAVYLLTYAEICLRPAHLDEAVRLARRAVELEASAPLAWCYLGSLLLEQRRLDESRRSFEQALELDPRLWWARCSLAVVQGRQGESAAAARQFERVLQDEAGNSEVLDHFAAFLCDQGRYDDALAQAEHALARKPGRLEHVLRAAEIELLLGRHGASLARLEAEADAGVRDARWLTLKSHLLRLLDRHDDALELCRSALTRGIESADLLRAYGLALHAAGAAEEALEVFERAALATHVLALSDKGVLLSQLGRLTQARETFEQALRSDPDSAEAWYNQSNITTYASGDSALTDMRRALDRQGVYRDRILLHFALGKAHLDAGEPTQAFAHWNEGNRMKRATIDYDADTAARRMAAIAARPLDDGAGTLLTDVPVFIVGMPRCGSSLVEQMLASHPEVHGAGELTRLRALFESGEPPDTLAPVALERLRRFAPGAKRIIDKDLNNFMHIGIVRRLFPRARIIHCRRDPLDTCFSAYSKLFVGSYGFTYDMRELGLYYRQYHALMTHWRAAVGGHYLLEIDYETVVAEPHAAARRLLDFLDLPWHDACLDFFETPRLVHTASFAQVRRPAYRSSVGRALPLRTHLEPLIAALGDLAPP